MRLIDAEALLKILELETDGFNHTETQYTMGFLDGKKQAMEVIYDMPTIDAEPVKHGHWIAVEDAWEDTLLTCSVCGEEMLTIENVSPEDMGMRYCPYCGARMDEVKNNAEE